MNLRIAMIGLMAVLALWSAPAHADASGTALTVVNNAALKAGQTMTIQAYKTLGAQDRLVKKIVVGPVEINCANGCGSGTAGFSDGPGAYRLEVVGANPADMAAVTFTLHEGETFTWMISNRASKNSLHATAPGVEKIADKGDYAINLINYAKIDTADVPQIAAAAPRKRVEKPFWPFRGSSRLHVNR